jgi:ADP-ribose pyrophosphatase
MSQPIEQAFVFCPQCAARHESPGQVPFRCTSCQFTVFFGPVAAVGGLIVDDSDHLLLVRRARNPGKGQWGLPGGFVDREETIEQALIREVSEETRLELDEVQLLLTFPNRYNYRGWVSPVIDLFYLCRPRDPSRLQLEEDELDRSVWTSTPRAYLDAMAFDSNRRAIEHWLQGKGAGLV